MHIVVEMTETSDQIYPCILEDSIIHKPRTGGLYKRSDDLDCP